MVPTDLSWETLTDKYRDHFMMPLTDLCGKCGSKMIYSEYSPTEHGPEVIAAYCPNGHGWFAEGM